MSKEPHITATVTAKGQVTIPVQVRESLGIRTGDKLDITLGEDGFVARPPPRRARRPPRHRQDRPARLGRRHRPLDRRAARPRY